MSKQYKKAGVLLSLIVAPVLFFFAIEWMGWVEAKVSLPYYIPIDVVEKKTSAGTEVDTIYHTVPPFEFINSEGKTITDEDVRGRIHLVNFIFTRCALECPKMTDELLRVNELFLKDPEIVILSHTVDPENDTPDVLKAYKESFGINNESWQFVTGDKKSIYQQGIKGYFLSAGEEDSDVGFFHSDKIVLIDREGHIRGYYAGTDTKEIDRLVTEITVLKQSYE